MTAMKLNTIKVGKHSADVEVSDSGYFTAEVDDAEYSAKTLAELTEQVKKALKRMSDKQAHVKVTVLGYQLTKDRFEPVEKADAVIHAVLRGKHERNHEYLLTADGGTKFKLRTWSEDKALCPRLSASQVEQYLALARARTAAAEAVAAFMKEHTERPEVLLKGQ
jgi:hypothetical protein